MLRDLIRPYLPKLISREMTNRAVAAQLNVSETHLCRVLKQLKVIKEAAPNSQARKALNTARKEYRVAVANSMTIQDAAAAAGCSTRTIYRLRGKK